MKKTICLITNWYPTKENPYAGVFFKEQAFAVADNFDFIVVHYKEHLKKRFGRTYQIDMVNKEQNTIEYDINVNVPISVYMHDLYHDFKVKHIDHNTITSIGKYDSEKRKKFTMSVLRQVFDGELKDSFDALYCVDAQSEAYILSCVSEITGKPYVVGEHAPVPWPAYLIHDVNKFAIEKADAFLAISYDKIRQLSLQNIRLPKTVYIGNLVDEELFTIVEKPENHIKTFAIVAANSFYKNYDMFIDVMNRLTEITEEAFKVLIVGYGANKGYSQEVNEFEERIRQTKFTDRVELIPEVPHSEIVSVYHKADAFVMTSIQEGQPVSAMEAACCGLPIFSTRCGGVEDYVDDKMGRIYNLTDYEGMANGLKQYLEGEINFQSEYIQKKIVDLFGKKTFSNNFVSVFDIVIK